MAAKGMTPAELMRITGLGVAVIRRYRPLTGKRAGTVELLAEHPDFPPLELNGSGRIIGRITKRISDI